MEQRLEENIFQLTTLFTKREAMILAQTGALLVSSSLIIQLNSSEAVFSNYISATRNF